MLRIYPPALAALLLGIVSLQQAAAEPPPRPGKVDAAIVAKLGAVTLAPALPQAYSTFYRRLHLDLVGTPPSPAASRGFRTADGKGRAATIGHLVADAARRGRWTEAEQSRVRQVVLEGLLSLDQ